MAGELTLPQPFSFQLCRTAEYVKDAEGLYLPLNLILGAKFLTLVKAVEENQLVNGGRETKIE